MSNKSKTQRRLCKFYGKLHTQKGTGDDYPTITWGEIVEMAQDPQTVDKAKAAAIIPSIYHADDARVHDVQTKNGMFCILSFDVDKGGPNIDKVNDAFYSVFGAIEYLIYSSRGSKEEYQKWRSMVPVMDFVQGADYSDTMEVLNNMLEEHGIELDRALELTGQPIYLPNKGEFYQSMINAGPKLKSVHDIPGFTHAFNELVQRKKREAAEALAQAKANAEARRKRAESGDVSPIDWFNDNNPITDVLSANGWEFVCNRRDHSIWVSPYSQSGGPSVYCYGMDGRCVSFTSSDVGNVGRVSANGRATYDAFDIFVARQHGGNEDAAIQAVLEEMRHAGVIKPKEPTYDFPDVDYVGAGSDDDFDNSGADAGNEPGHIGNYTSNSDNLSNSSEQESKPIATFPTPVAKFKEADLPRRQWIYGKLHIRGFVNLTVSAGGIGKTSLSMAEALAIVTGKDLLGEAIHEQTNVWIVNQEDPLDEMNLRLAAAMREYGVTHDDIEGKLFMDAEDTAAIMMAGETRDGVAVNLQLYKFMRDKIIEHNIGVVILDPFISIHAVNENSNGSIQQVVALLRKLSRETNAAVSLVHHVRKGNGEEATIDSARGAGSLAGAVRTSRVINKVLPAKAMEMGIEQNLSTGVFSIIDGKNNLAPPLEKTTICRMKGIQLDNGEWLGVAVRLDVPDAWGDITEADVNAILRIIERGRTDVAEPYMSNPNAKAGWVGNVIIDYATNNSVAPLGKSQAKQILKTWTENGLIETRKFNNSDSKERVGCFVIDCVGEV